MSEGFSEGQPLSTGWRAALVGAGFAACALRVLLVAGDRWPWWPWWFPWSGLIVVLVLALRTVRVPDPFLVAMTGSVLSLAGTRAAPRERRVGLGALAGVLSLAVWWPLALAIHDRFDLGSWIR